MKSPLLGNRLKDLRIARNLRPVDVWKATGIDGSNLVNMERARKHVSLESAVRLAKMYDCTVEFLVEGCLDEADA